MNSSASTRFECSSLPISRLGESPGDCSDQEVRSISIEIAWKLHFCAVLSRRYNRKHQISKEAIDLED